MYLFIYLSISLLSEMATCSRFFFCICCLTPRISHFSKKPWALLLVSGCWMCSLLRGLFFVGLLNWQNRMCIVYASFLKIIFCFILQSNTCQDLRFILLPDRETNYTIEIILKMELYLCLLFCSLFSTVRTLSTESVLFYINDLLFSTDLEKRSQRAKITLVLLSPLKKQLWVFLLKYWMVNDHAKYFSFIMESL